MSKRPLHDWAMGEKLDGAVRLVKCALYGRVSTKEGKQHLENQLRQLRAYAKKMRWTIGRYYTDEQSGASAHRPGLDAMMEAAARREFDVVLVWDLSRLTRRGPASAFQLIERLAAAGVELWSMREEHFRTPVVGKLLIAIAAFIAEQERENISSRVRAGIDRARASGKTLGRPARVVDRSKIVKLRKAGHSLRDIASRLNVSKSTIERKLTTQ
jgi:DNA invertase Pin-like site-specific DNA recombinase